MTSRPQLPVFVYGTLRRGEKNYRPYLEGNTLNEEAASVEGRLYFVADGGYPYLLPGGGRVIGDLMTLDPAGYEETLRSLDALEDYDPEDEEGSLYLRRKTKARREDGPEEEAWVYYWNAPGIRGKRIAEGDFKRRSRAL